MSLAKSLSSFKSELAGAASRNTRPVSTPPARTLTPNLAGEKRNHDAAFQPIAPPRGGGRELMTFVLNGISRLKEKSPQLISFEDLCDYLSLPAEARNEDKKALIKQALRANDRVEFMPNVGKGKDCFKYRSIHPVTNADELRTYLATINHASGVSVKELKDGWPDCTESINELEKNGFVLVIRGKKDNAPKTVYPDTPNLHVEVPAPGSSAKRGAPEDMVVGRPDEIFVDFWNKNKPPSGENDLRQDLEKAGLTPSSVVKEPKKILGQKKDRKRANRRGGKVTNAHMLDILKSYGPRGQ